MIYSHVVVFHRHLNIAFCKKCDKYIPKSNLNGNIARHLRQTHNLDADFSKSAEKNCLDDMKAQLELTTSEKALCDSYHAAGKLRGSGKPGRIVLLMLPHLHVEKKYECQDCWKLVEYKEHSTVPKTKCDRNVQNVCSLELCLLQSLFGGKTKELFPVFENNAISTECKWMHKAVTAMSKTAGCFKMGENTTPARMDAFVATLRFDRHLAALNCSMEKAFLLLQTSGLDSKPVVAMKRLLKQYMEKAYEICLGNPFIKTHEFLGSRLNVILEEKTLDRYGDRAFSLLVFLLNVGNETFGNEVIIKPSIRSRMDKLWETAERSTTTTTITESLMELHKVLLHVMF